jgi:hypothetical protein
MPSDCPLGADAAFADGWALACPDFDPVLCACAQPGPARTSAASVIKAKIHRPLLTLFPLLFLSLIFRLLFSDLFRPRRLPKNAPVLSSLNPFAIVLSPPLPS